MLRIHQALQAGKRPNASTFVRALEVSTKSIHRAIEFMRDRPRGARNIPTHELGAPASGHGAMGLTIHRRAVAGRRLNRFKDWGDQTSWQDFFDTYWHLIYNVAIKAGLSDTEAQEVVQGTVIAVARNIGEFKADPAHGSFGAWLMQLTRWRIADQWRKRGKVGQASRLSGAGETPALRSDDTGSTGEIERIPDPASMALDALWQEEWEKHLMAAALERVKRQVSPRQFQMFDLHVRQNLSVQETARTLQASAASVYMAKHRVARLVKKEIRKLEQSER